MAQTNIEKIDPSYRVNINANIAGTPGWFMSQVVGAQEGGLGPEVTAEWKAPIQLGGDALNNAVQLLGTGGSFRTREFASNAWQGTESMAESVTVKFLTWRDPVEDVWKPIWSMLMYGLPGVGQRKNQENWFLDPPVGKTQSGVQQSISVSLGTRVTYSDVLPQKVAPEFAPVFCDSPNYSGAWPIAGQVQFGFKISEAPTRRMDHLRTNFQF